MLSIDIGSKKICIVEGSYRGGQVVVSACGEIEYTTEVIVNGAITDRTTLCFLINEITKTHRMKSKNAIITINSTDIVAREFKLPNIPAPKLQLLVKNEMLRVVGSENDFIVDYLVTDSSDDKLLTIMAYALSKEIVESYYTLLKDAGLKPAALDIHANSISKLLSNASVNGAPIHEGNVIVADIGFSKILFHGFSGGVCRFNRTEISPVQEFIRELGSLKRVEITREVMQELNLSPEAEYDGPIIADTCRYFVSRVADEIQRYSQYIMFNSVSKSVTQIYICGGVTTIEGFDRALSNALKIPVQTVSKIDRLTLPQTCNAALVCNAAGALIRI